jgi:hypothetical protein
VTAADLVAQQAANYCAPRRAKAVAVAAGGDFADRFDSAAILSNQRVAPVHRLGAGLAIDHRRGGRMLRRYVDSGLLGSGRSHRGLRQRQRSSIRIGSGRIRKPSHEGGGSGQADQHNGGGGNDQHRMRTIFRSTGNGHVHIVFFLVM